MKRRLSALAFVLVTGALAACSSFADAQSVQWTRRVPAPRYGHAMAYDVARNVTVLFGGYYSDGAGHDLRDTWEWNGSAWTQRASSGPSARAYHAMAYDAARGVTVLFSGYPAGADTWEWNGSAWVQRST